MNAGVTMGKRIRAIHSRRLVGITGLALQAIGCHKGENGKHQINQRERRADLSRSGHLQQRRATNLCSCRKGILTLIPSARRSRESIIPQRISACIKNVVTGGYSGPISWTVGSSPIWHLLQWRDIKKIIKYNQYVAQCVG